MLENSIPLSSNTSHGVNMLLHGFDPDMSLLFGIDMAGDKVIMAPIISEDPSYEDNELKKYCDFSCMFCNLSHEKNSGRRGYFIARWYHRNK